MKAWPLILGMSLALAGCGTSPTASPTATAETKVQASGKKLLSTRPLSAQEKRASYEQMLATAFAEARAWRKDPMLIDSSADQLTPSLAMQDSSSMTFLFAPTGMHLAFLELQVKNGTLTRHQWGAFDSFRYAQMKQMQGGKLPQIKDASELQPVGPLLAKVNMAPVSKGADSVNVYFLDLKKNPGYVAHLYQGRRSLGVAMFNAVTGEVYGPKQ